MIRDERGQHLLIVSRGAFKRGVTLVAADATTGRRIVVDRRRVAGWPDVFAMHWQAGLFGSELIRPAPRIGGGAGLWAASRCQPIQCRRQHLAHHHPRAIPTPRFLSNPPKISSPNENENENRFEPCHCLHRFRCTEITPLVILELSSPSLSEAQYVEASMMGLT